MTETATDHGDTVGYKDPEPLHRLTKAQLIERLEATETAFRDATDQHHKETQTHVTAYDELSAKYNKQLELWSSKNAQSERSEENARKRAENAEARILDAQQREEAVFQIIRILLDRQTQGTDEGER